MFPQRTHNRGQTSGFIRGCGEGLKMVQNEWVHMELQQQQITFSRKGKKKAEFLFIFNRYSIGCFFDLLWVSVVMKSL